MMLPRCQLATELDLERMAGEIVDQEAHGFL
jgi:hypothetical protein